MKKNYKVNYKQVKLFKNNYNKIKFRKKLLLIKLMNRFRRMILKQQSSNLNRLKRIFQNK